MTSGWNERARGFASAPRRFAGKMRGKWRSGDVYGMHQPSWWPTRLAWPSIEGPHDDKEVVVFAAGRRYEFAPAEMRGCRGHVHNGTRRPGPDEVAVCLTQLGLPDEAARPLAIVSGFEGGFDAIQTYDRAKFSWGFVQFSATGGLYDVLRTIKTDEPDVFDRIFEPAGIDAHRWNVVVRRGRRTHVGRRAHDLLHDEPTLWTPFLTAASLPAVQAAQVKTAYLHYYEQPMRALGDVFADSEAGRTLVLDRAVRRGPSAAVALFRTAIERVGRAGDSAAVIESLIELEAYDHQRLRSIVDQLATTADETDPG